MSKETRTTSSTGGQKGTKLERFDLIPIGPLTALARHYGVGATKYANHQWRNGYEWSKSYAALQRHLTAFWAGYDYDVCSNDPDGCQHVDAEGRPFVAINDDACFNHTGSHHMAAVAWHAFCLLEFVERFPEHDDRYVPNTEREVEVEWRDPAPIVIPISEVKPGIFDQPGTRVLAQQEIYDAETMLQQAIMRHRRESGPLWRLQNQINESFNRMQKTARLT